VAVATVYDGRAAAWENGAGAVYRPLAGALVAESPVALSGRLVLDAGSGTGAVAVAAVAAGARVVAADQSAGMIAYGRADRWPAVAADVLTLPFGDGVFDGVIAGFLLNHLPPVPTLAEMVRVVAGGGFVLASTWSAGEPDPVKAVVESVLRRSGWTPPAWFQTMKAEIEPVSGDPDHLAAAAVDAGLAEVSASVRRPDLGVRDPAAFVGYRFALPHVAPWVGAMDARARSVLTAEAVAAVGPYVEGWRPAMVVVVGRVVRHRSRRTAQRSSAPA
jgi:SAM-dependent methyltransferase